MTRRGIDGFAILNTKYVLAALTEYDKALLRMPPGGAELVAIESYAHAAGKRVCGNTVRRWRRVVRTYGSIAQVPENAFGGRKSHANLRSPVRLSLSRCITEIKRLRRSTNKGNGASPSDCAELVSIISDLATAAALVYGDHARPLILAVERICKDLRAASTVKTAILSLDQNVAAQITALPRKLAAMRHRIYPAGNR